MAKIIRKTSGTKHWWFVTGTDDELKTIARKVKVEVKEDGRGKHLDVSGYKAKLAEKLCQNEFTDLNAQPRG